MSNASGWQVPDAAPRHYQDQVWRFMDPFAEALVESSVISGDTVLDVACGTGIATRAAAAIVGDLGRVVGSDINAAMLDLAASISRTSGDSIDWREASALDLPYSDGIFDCVICQQGIQFFPDPAVGLKEMARVTRPGGKIAATVWSDLTDSPYFDAMYHMLVRYCDAKPEDLAWSSQADQITEWFTDGGLGEPDVKRIERSVSLPPLDTFVPSHMKATPWAGQFENLSQRQFAEAIAYMAKRLAPWRTESGVTTPFVSYLAIATNRPHTTGISERRISSPPPS